MPAQLIRICPTQRFKGRYFSDRAGCCERITPHGSKRRGCDDQTARVFLRYSGRHIRLPHSYVVAQKRTTELIQS
jgi:hypothetical protein